MDYGKTLLEQIYSGGIFPAEDIVPNSPEHKAAMNELSRLREKLEAKLPERSEELLDEYDGAFEDAHRLHLRLTYAEGVRFGVRLMLETFCEGGKLPPHRKKD